MPIAVHSRRPHRAARQAQLSSQSWTQGSVSGQSGSRAEDLQLPPRSKSYDEEDDNGFALPSRHASRASVDDEPVDLKGPFAVKLLGWEVLGQSHSVRYKLQVTGSDGERVVCRRYTSFARLSAAMGSTAPKPPPEMPPKSFFRKRLSLGFMQERSRCLELIAAAAVAADPHADTVAVRRFLGFEGSEEPVHENPASDFQAERGRRMETIAEAEFESSIGGSQLLSSLEVSKLFASGVGGPETWSLISDAPARQREPVHLGSVVEGDVYEDPRPEAPAVFDLIE